MIEQGVLLMLITEKRSNLMIMPCTLVCCISADFTTCAGFSKQLRDIGVGEVLNRNSPKWEGVGYCLPVDIIRNEYFPFPQKVYNLVIKDKYWHKSSYDTMKQALLSMKKLIIRDNIKTIAMPKIGCSLDRLRWAKVKTIIAEIFKDTDIKIIVCHL